MDLINGKPTGAVRISFGRTSTEEDILALEQMIDSCFVESESSPLKDSAPLNLGEYNPRIANLFSFPIKSVGSVAKER